jgi:serine/threonine protein kinase/tetratricopeptide (TPR) repeat protein
MSVAPGTRLASYEIVALLGAGGMGEVYRARDIRLNRHVALKVISADDQARTRGETKRRFLNEARAAAAVNHPNICQIFEIGEERDTLFITMELLSGETLADRLLRGPLAVSQAIPLAVDTLNALQVIHEQGLVHRDLKPSNIFLTPHGVKILDFGLASPVSPVAEAGLTQTATRFTQSGAMMGTPSYMAPEQIEGRSTDARTDVFAMGATLFEMLSGTPAFGGATSLDVLHATLHSTPAALGGSRTIESVNRIVQRMLAKTPDQRPASASVVAEELKACLVLGDVEAVPRARTITWLIVLPFRVLRPDSETDFLSFSLPDAIASSLAGLRSLGVRSTAGAARFAGGEVDFARIAAEAHVDLVMTGTLLRAGDAIRVTTQLVGAPGGEVLWSHSAQATLRDVFQLQDDLVQRIVGSLSLPLTAGEHQLLKHDVPASPTAYEFYLRANEVLRQVSLASLEPAAIARDLYLRSVEGDSQYAPAWAGLGRCYRVLAKGGGEGAEENMRRAESCLQRALSLNPRLPSVTRTYAQIESDMGRSKDGLVRLLTAVQTNDRDPELWAGLVHACRYCGLLSASLAAHDRACRLDPAISTSVRHTYFLLGDPERSLSGIARFYFEAMVLSSMGRSDEALAYLQEMERVKRPELMRNFFGSLRLLLEGKHAESLTAAEYCIHHFQDPEAVFYMARQLVKMGEIARGVEVLHDVLNRGYLFSAGLRTDPWLKVLQSTAAYDDLLRRARSLEAEAELAFTRSGGRELLGT